MKFYNSDSEYEIIKDFEILRDMLYTDKIEYSDYVGSLKELCIHHNLKYNFIGVTKGEVFEYFHCATGENVNIRFPISKLFIDFELEKTINKKRACY